MAPCLCSDDACEGEGCSIKVCFDSDDEYAVFQAHLLIDYYGTPKNLKQKLDGLLVKSDLNAVKSLISITVDKIKTIGPTKAAVEEVIEKIGKIEPIVMSVPPALQSLLDEDRLFIKGQLAAILKHIDNLQKGCATDEHGRVLLSAFVQRIYDRANEKVTEEPVVDELFMKIEYLTQFVTSALSTHAPSVVDKDWLSMKQQLYTLVQHVGPKVHLTDNLVVEDGKIESLVDLIEEDIINLYFETESKTVWCLLKKALGGFEELRKEMDRVLQEYDSTSLRLWINIAFSRVKSKTTEYSSTTVEEAFPTYATTTIFTDEDLACIEEKLDVLRQHMYEELEPLSPWSQERVEPESSSGSC